jgi:hypothetical protein
MAVVTFKDGFGRESGSGLTAWPAVSGMVGDGEPGTRHTGVVLLSGGKSTPVEGVDAAAPSSVRLSPPPATVANASTPTHGAQPETVGAPR